MSHPAHIYTTLESLLFACVGTDTTDKYYDRSKRYWTRKWKQHLEKKGNVPMILKCEICSGKEQKMDIRLGKYRISTRAEQDERKAELEERE